MNYVRLKDVAERAGVTVTAVSRALKDKSDISENTKKRIRKIANEMGYIPNANASTLRSNSHRTIGIVVTYLDNFFYNRILMGITDSLSRKGYTPIIFSNQEDPRREAEILKTLAGNRVAGALIVPASDLVNENQYNQYNYTCVTIVRRKLNEELNYFINDSEKAGELVANDLMAKGCRNPAYIGVDLPISCNQSRQSGFARALSDNGISLRSDRILNSKLSLSETYDITRDLVRKDRTLDSIFVYNDNLAFAVIRALHDSGVRMPEDIRVYGHDDVKEARFSTPSLTTVKVPKYKLGFESASNLVSLIEDGKGSIQNKMYDPELIERES